MRHILAAAILLAALSHATAQTDVQPLVETQQEFGRAAADRGVKSAFLEFLTDDAVIFSPTPVNGKQFWKTRDAQGSARLERNLTFSDISANGLLGYTTGNWRLYQQGKSEGLARFGQYVTIWEKKPDGKFRASLDIAVSHEKLPFWETDQPIPKKPSRDANKRGWSPADASMNFLRASMSSERLGGAYKKFAADDVRLLRDSAPPIIGKRRVVKEMEEYVSVEFPKDVILFQSADMAYTWNSCEFADSNEGTEKGNCLHIWKLRKKKWWIVVGVFSPAPNETQPVLKMASKP
jgi:ketosteroid isomerase-like protein